MEFTATDIAMMSVSFFWGAAVGGLVALKIYNHFKL